MRPTSWSSLLVRRWENVGCCDGCGSCCASSSSSSGSSSSSSSGRYRVPRKPMMPARRIERSRGACHDVTATLSRDSRPSSIPSSSSSSSTTTTTTTYRALPTDDDDDRCWWRGSPRPQHTAARQAWRESRRHIQGRRRPPGSPGPGAAHSAAPRRGLGAMEGDTPRALHRAEPHPPRHHRVYGSKV